MRARAHVSSTSPQRIGPAHTAAQARQRWLAVKQLFPLSETAKEETDFDPHNPLV